MENREQFVFSLAVTLPSGKVRGIDILTDEADMITAQFVSNLTSVLLPKLHEAVSNRCHCGLYPGDACSDARHCGTIS